jgi:ribA/ribD-fused uncharacterized protein
MTTQAPSNQWNTPWRASGFAVYDTSGNLVAHTGITGNRSMHGKQLELMAAMIAEAVNAYSSHEPLPALDRYSIEMEGDICGAVKVEKLDPNGEWVLFEDVQPFLRSAQPPAIDLEMVQDYARLVGIVPPDAGVPLAMIQTLRKQIECAMRVCGAAPPPGVGPLKLDTDRQVFFYEQDHYYLSNFSAFMLQWNGYVYPTSEHAYQAQKFPDDPLKQTAIARASSAHDAFKMAERWKQYRRPDWDEIKVDVMRYILAAKADQHEYVRRKLMETGDRELIENSWRDDMWGWGPNRDGQNLLGKLWMEIRAELRASALTKGEAP